MSNYNLDNLYGHRHYIQPEREPWIPWFAWRPIQLVYWCDEAPFGTDHPIKLSKILWLTTVLRRRVIDNTAGPGHEFAPSYTYWEYTTVFDLFKWGHSE